MTTEEIDEVGDHVGNAGLSVRNNGSSVSIGFAVHYVVGAPCPSGSPLLEAVVTYGHRAVAAAQLCLPSIVPSLLVCQ